jgi:hypothetical protein
VPPSACGIWYPTLDDAQWAETSRSLFSAARSVAGVERSD